MKRKFVLSLLVIITLLIITGCGKNVKETDVVSDLNSILDKYYEDLDKEGIQSHLSLKDFRERLSTYSNYVAIDRSDNEFSTKPTNPNEKTYTMVVGLCDYRLNDGYVLIYNKDTDKYYSVKHTCEEYDRGIKPVFKKADELK